MTIGPAVPRICATIALLPVAAMAMAGIAVLVVAPPALLARAIMA